MVEIDEHDHAGFAIDLKKWLQIMDAYEAGGHAYHATLPTDAIAALRESRSIRSVAAEGFQAPGVVVSYTEDDGFKSGAKFIAKGLQTAAGVPLQCDEPADFKTFRIGLFGLDKLRVLGLSCLSLGGQSEAAMRRSPVVRKQSDGERQLPHPTNRDYRPDPAGRGS